jgi:2-amino-4-hydroxy-6-hydroxymethyldihydropteridine diphosphokinase
LQVHTVILIGLGANLPGRAGSPARTLEAALRTLEADLDIRVVARSDWYESAPVPASDQPWFVNGVAEIETALPPSDLLARLHDIEAAFGRQRGAENAARTLDLDLLDYHGRIDAGWPVLPHPRLQDRAFVLLPLADIRPEWRHPVTGLTVKALLALIDPSQVARALGDRGDLP